MSVLFFLLFLVSPVFLIIGVVKPKIFTKILRGKTPARSNIALIFAFLTFIFLILSALTTPLNFGDNTHVTAPSIEATKVNEVGTEAYLRVPNNSDDEQKIPLAPSKEISSKVTEVLLAKDWYGLQELMLKEGVFAVPNGTKVVVIDKSFGLRKVRVLEGDMQGVSGWLPMEFVVNE